MGSVAVANTDADVVVVGGGPCGMVTALLLGRFGVRTLLLEKHAALLPHPKAMAITRRSGEIFRQLGLLQPLLAAIPQLSADAMSVWCRNGLTGEQLGVTPLAPDDHRYSPCDPLHCPQPITEAVLWQAVQAEALVSCRRGTTLTAFEQDGTGVRLSCAAGDGRACAVSARYLVAADGDSSGVRERLGINRQGPGEMGRFLSVYFKAPLGEHLQGRRALLLNSLGDTFYEAFVAVNGTDLWLMHHFLEEGQGPADFAPEHLVRLVQQGTGLPDLAVELISVSPWVMSPSIASQWRQGRVLLVGDAAARVSPTGGLGMNNGIQSAHNLAWKLAEVIQGRADDALLDTYQAERLPAAHFIYETSQGFAGELFNTVTAALSGDWETAKQQINSSRRGGKGYGLDFGVSYTSAAIQSDGSTAEEPGDWIHDYCPQARPGHRAPHVWVECDGQQISTLDCFGQGFVLMAAAGADCSAALARYPQARIWREGQHFHDPAGQWHELYGLSHKGLVVVRPDGYVAWRER